MARVRRVRIWLGLAVGASVAMVTAALLRWPPVPQLTPNPAEAWVWVERISWTAGVASLVALIPLMGDLLKTLNRRATQTDRVWRADPAGPIGPGTSSVDVPLGRLDTSIRGRDELIRHLKKSLNQRGDGQNIHVLHGLGGCGKTTMALLLARWAARRGWTVWWVSAGTRTDLYTGMRHVVEQAGADPYETQRAWAGSGSATDRLWRRLNGLRHRWLLTIMRRSLGEHHQRTL